MFALLLLLCLAPAPAPRPAVDPFPLDRGAWDMQWGQVAQPGTAFARDGVYDSGTFGAGRWLWKIWDPETGELTVEFTERGLHYVLVVDRDGNGSGARFWTGDDGARDYGAPVEVRLRRARAP